MDLPREIHSITKEPVKRNLKWILFGLTTGKLTVVDERCTMMNNLSQPVDVLLKLRADRWGAIQNEQQYLMVYQALLDYIQVR